MQIKGRDQCLMIPSSPSSTSWSSTWHVTMPCDTKLWIIRHRLPDRAAQQRFCKKDPFPYSKYQAAKEGARTMSVRLNWRPIIRTPDKLFTTDQNAHATAESYMQWRADSGPQKVILSWKFEVPPSHDATGSSERTWVGCPAPAGATETRYYKGAVQCGPWRAA